MTETENEAPEQTSDEVKADRIDMDDEVEFHYTEQDMQAYRNR